MRPRAFLYALLVTITASVIAPPARAQSGADLIAACKENGGSPRLCVGLNAQLRQIGGICRDATADAAECALADGVTISEALVKAHEKSWLANALRLQRGLDGARPLHDELWVHTHNSFNADAYPPTFYGLDRNQIYAIDDQLRMGVRAIELDLWFQPNIATDGSPALTVCHGEPIPVGPLILPLGCTPIDPLFTERLQEIKDWLVTNRNEVVVLYLENTLLKDPAAHNLAGQAIARVLGPLVYTPKTSCASFPVDVSRNTILEARKQIVIAGNCDATGTSWGKWVHVRGDRWKEGGLDYGDDFPKFPCIAERKKDEYSKNWVRHWGDETGLSAGADAGGDVTVADARNMIRCGVNMAGMDNLVPLDPRLEQFVWSWAKDEPRAAGLCAAQNSAGRFYSTPCSQTARTFACLNGTTWSLTRGRGMFKDGERLCASEKLGRFSVPWSGWENELLKAAKTKAHAKDVWLNYTRSSSAWTPHI